METSVRSPSWQRVEYYPGLEQTTVYTEYYDMDANTDRFEEGSSQKLATDKDPRSSTLKTRYSYDRHSGIYEEFIPDEYLKTRQHPDPPESFPNTHHLPRHYHEHEEAQTDFRSNFMKTLNRQQRDFSTTENHSAVDSFYGGRTDPTVYAPMYSLHYHDHGEYTDSEFNDGLAEQHFQDMRSRANEDAYMTNSEMTSSANRSAAKIERFDRPENGLFKLNSFGDNAHEECDSEKEEEEKVFHQDYPQHSWHTEYNDSGEDADWKRPDMHMFKTSSYKGSVTSERSSRLDPHTYQSYTAGLLYSSGRSEKFLNLQKHFAVLERIGELDKSSTQTEIAHKQITSRHELGHSEQSFHSQEELEELYSELKEARKKKEFFYDTDKVEQVQWSPEKDFGLKKREHKLRDRLKTYQNMVEDKMSKSSSSLSSRQESMKRAVSFGALYEKFSASEKAEPGKDSSKYNHTSPNSEHKFAAASSLPTESQASEQVEISNISPKSSCSNPGSLSYLQLMESAAQKSKQRAIHGTHLDAPRSDYEAYVEEVKKIGKGESDVGSGHIRKSSLKSPFLETPPESQTFSDFYSSREKPEYSSDTRHKTSHEFVIDSSSIPRPDLKVKFGRDDEKSVTQSFSRDNIPSSVESYAGACGKPVDSTDLAESQIYRQRPQYAEMTPKYSVTSTVYSEKNSTYSQMAPSYTETTPKYSDTALNYSETNPRYSKTAPRNLEMSPKYSDTAPKNLETAYRYSDTASKISEMIPRYSDTAQKYSVTTPTYSETAPEYSKSASRYSETASSCSETILSYSDMEHTYSDTSERAMNSDRQERPRYSETTHKFSDMPERSKLSQVPPKYSETPPKYSEMPDIIQMEKHNDPYRASVPKSKSNRSTHSVSVNPGPQEISSTAHQTYVNPKAEGIGRIFSQEKLNERFVQEDKVPEAQQTFEMNSTAPSENCAVFHVKNLRKLAENNEFSINQLSWMKKPNASHADREDAGYRSREQLAETPRSAVEKTFGDTPTYSVSKTDPEKSSDIVVPQRTYSVAKQTVPMYASSVTPFEKNSTSAPVEKKTFLPSAKPESLNLKPVLSQSVPAFSSAKRAVESRARQMDSSEHNVPLYENAYVEKSAERNTRHLARPWSGKGTEQTGIVFVNAPAHNYPSSVSQRADKESKLQSGATAQRSGDGSDLYENPDKQYGQLRKWTAVADIYRDVEKSWSPTREARPFPPENNSSISSTDTFIVKDTDDEDTEQDDMGSSIGSVSQLRAIFERQQKMNKFKSEPDMSQDSSAEPRRPRSAKSQADVNSAGKEDGCFNNRIQRTVSGDLSEIRHHYENKPLYDDRELPQFEPDTLTHHSCPTDVALRAWVHYTGKPRYDPYLPPEDILKEVSATSTGRKLDVPKPKNYRPSNVSRMTLEYFDQIGSEWQQSHKKSPIPYSSQPERAGQQYSADPMQSDGQRLDRRYLSHQYVNEEPPFSNYPQTDDLKLKQSQWAGTTGLSEQRLPPRTPNFQTINSSFQRSDKRPGYTVPHLEQNSTNDISKPVKTLTRQYESIAPQTLDVQSKPHSSTVPARWPVSHLPATTTSDSKPQTAPAPARRPRSQLSQVPTTETRTQPQASSPQTTTSQVASLASQRFSPANKTPVVSSGLFPRNQTPNTEDFKSEDAAQKLNVPPEPTRQVPASPLSPHRLPKPQPRALQHSHSKSSDSEHSSGDYGGVYCVSTGSVLYGVEADEEEPVPPPPQSQSSLVSSSATFPRKHAARQSLFQAAQQGNGNLQGSSPTPRNPAYSSPSSALGTAPAPPTRGGGAIRGAGTLPLPRSKTFATRGSSLSAAEQLGVKSPPPSSTAPEGFASAVSAGSGTTPSNPIPSATAAFKHQTTDERRPRPEPVNPEKERRRKEEEEAYRKKRLEELYEEERLKKMKKDEIDAEARRHHDFYSNAQKSPISPNRFDDAPSSLASTPGSLGTLERKDPQYSVPPERRRGFQIQGKARALFNFTAQNPREMSFRKNDIIYLLRQVDKNWFEGERHGLVGIFPTNYVEVVTSIEAAQAAAMQAEGQGRARFTFTAQSSVELSIRKGEFVVLLRRVDENWYEGRIGNRQGIFPVNYVEVTREPSTPLITPAPSVITTPMTGTPEMLSPVGYDAAPTPPPQPSPSAFTTQRSPYGFNQPQNYGPASSSLLTPASSMPRQQINLNRQEPDFSGPRSPISNPKSPISNPKSPVSPGGRLGSPAGRRVSPGPSPASGPASRLLVDIHSSAKPFANGQPPSSAATRVTDDDLAVTRYRALYAYRPQNEDELELREGDEVFVMEKCDDGWFVGTSARTGCFGTFPGNYVQKICE